MSALVYVAALVGFVVVVFASMCLWLDRSAQRTQPVRVDEQDHKRGGSSLRGAE